MKRILLLISVIFMLHSNVNAQMLSTIVIDTPTAYTVERGSYHFNVLAYDHGGFEFKTFIGLHENLYLGVSFNIDNAIGTGRARPNVPGVIAKIKIYNGADFFPAIAIGYDSFYIGRDSVSDGADDDYNRIIYGPYLAFTSPIYLFDSEQFINYGVRLPVQPDYEPDDTSYFIGLDIPLGEYFRIRGEVERVFWNFRHTSDWLFNFGIKYVFLDTIAIELDFMYDPGEPLNRIIRIEYHGQF